MNNKEEKLTEILTEIFGVKEVTEDSIMSEAKRIFKYQESVGNPYSMYVAYEFATKELGKLKQRSEASMTNEQIREHLLKLCLTKGFAKGVKHGKAGNCR